MLTICMGDKFNRCICPLQLCRCLTLYFFLERHVQIARLLHVDNFGDNKRRLSITPIIGPTVLGCETNQEENHGLRIF